MLAFAAVAALGLFWRDIPVPTTGKTLGAHFAAGAMAPARNAIAVLPFTNMTGDSGNDYLGDGLAEELLHRLAKIPGLRVAARSSAFAYRGKEVDARQVADALGVSYVVEGSVRRQGERVRVNAALVERASGANRWSNSYETSGDLFAIEDDIGRQVLTALELVLGIKAGAGPAPPRGATTLPRPTTSTCEACRACASRAAPARWTKRSACSSARSRSNRVSRAPRPDYARRAWSATCSSAFPPTWPLPRKPARGRARSTTLHTKFTRPSAACGS